MVVTAEQERNLINLRRSKVSELLSKGYASGVEIARTLNVSEPTISRDISWINKQASENLHSFTQKRLAIEFYNTINSYDYIIRTASHTVDTTQDERTKNEALKIVRDTRAVRMDLISNVDVMSYQMSKQNKPSPNLVEGSETEKESEVEQQEQEQEIENGNNQ